MKLLIALGLIAVAAVLALFIDAITSNLVWFFGVVVVFAIGLVIVGVAAPFKRSKSGLIL